MLFRSGPLIQGLVGLAQHRPLALPFLLGLRGLRGPALLDVAEPLGVGLTQAQTCFFFFRRRFLGASGSAVEAFAPRL